jgi:hypothetical protein
LKRIEDLPTQLNVVVCGPWHDIAVGPGPSCLVVLCTAHALENGCLWPMA